MIITPETSITLSFSELQSLMTRMARLGAQACLKETNPAKDEMNERETKRWMKANGMKPVLLEKLVEEGTVRPKRRGQSKNSPKIYSMYEIQTALATIDTIPLFVKQIKRQDQQAIMA